MQQIYLTNYVVLKCIHIPWAHRLITLSNPHFFLVHRAHKWLAFTMLLKWHLMKDAKKLTHDFMFWQAFNIRIFFLIFAPSFLQYSYLSCSWVTLIEENLPCCFAHLSGDQVPLITLGWRMRQMLVILSLCMKPRCIMSLYKTAYEINKHRENGYKTTLF